MNNKFIILCTVIFVTVGQLTVTFYLPSLPQMTREFGVTIGAMQNSVTVFLLAYAVSQLFYGFLSDIFGRKKCLLFGLSLVIVSTALLIVYDQSFTMFLVCRFLQGLGASSVSVLARAVIRDKFSQDELLKALAILIMSVSLTPSVAPMIGGWIDHLFNWQMVFKVLLGYTIIITLLVFFFLPETLSKKQGLVEDRQKFKFVVRELFTHEIYLFCILMIGLVYSAQVIYLSLCPFIFQHTFHISVALYGTLLVIPAFGLFIGNYIVKQISSKLHPKRLILISISMILGAGLLLALLPNSWLTISVILALLFLMTTGVAFGFSTLTSLALKPFKKSAGAAAAISGLSQMCLPAAILFIVSHFHVDTVHPLGVVIAVLGGLLSILYLKLNRA